MKTWLRKTDDGTVIKVHVIPNAKKNVIVGDYNGYLKIKVSSPPVDGSANKEIKKFFSKIFKISKSKIEIVKGEKNRDKEILNTGKKFDKIKKILEEQNAHIRVQM